jgi:hypothetical protein
MTLALTNDTKGIKVKLLGNVKGEFQLNDKTIYMEIFKRVCKQYHTQRSAIIDSAAYHKLLRIIVSKYHRNF